jgi:thioredoxin-related protein
VQAVLIASASAGEPEPVPVPQPATGAAGIFALMLKSLRTIEPIALNRYADKKLVLVFFEPECTWCARQIKMLEEINHFCGFAVQPVLIGTHGNRQALQAFLRRTQTQLPAFETSTALLKITGDVSSTPLTLIIDAHGAISEKIRGYSPDAPELKILCSASAPIVQAPVPLR